MKINYNLHKYFKTTNAIDRVRSRCIKRPFNKLLLPIHLFCTYKEKCKVRVQLSSKCLSPSRIPTTDDVCYGDTWLQSKQRGANLIYQEGEQKKRVLGVIQRSVQYSGHKRTCMSSSITRFKRNSEECSKLYAAAMMRTYMVNIKIN